MKTNLLAAVLPLSFILFMSVPAVAQRGTYFETMSAEEIKKTLDASQGAEAYFDFAEAALRTRRMDLVSIAFNYSNTYTKFWQEIAESPDSSFRDTVSLEMIKSNSSAWTQFDPFYGGARGALGPMQEPFTSVLKKYLPNLALDDSLLTTREARQKLASQLEKAMTAKGVETPKSNTAAPAASSPSTTSHIPPATVATQNQPAIVADHAPSVQVAPTSQGHGVMLWLLAIVAAIGGLWMLMRKSSR